MTGEDVKSAISNGNAGSTGSTGSIFPVAHNNMMLRIVDNVVAECNGAIHAIKICSVTP